MSNAIHHHTDVTDAVFGASTDLPHVVAGLTTTVAPAWPAVGRYVEEIVGAGEGSLRTVNQVHGSMIVDDASWHPGAEADGLCTNQPGRIVAVRVADCCGILMVDPHRRVVAAIHSGWRGTAHNIARAAVDHLRTTYQVQAEHLHVWLSPCASGTEYEVGQDVHRLLSDYCSPNPRNPATWLFDNTRAITQQLTDAGVRNVTASGCCTISDPRFHSFRRDRERAGRGLAFIALR